MGDVDQQSGIAVFDLAYRIDQGRLLVGRRDDAQSLGIQDRRNGHDAEGRAPQVRLLSRRFESEPGRVTLRPSDRYLATGAWRQERFRRDGDHRATCVYGDVIFDGPSSAVRPTRLSRIDTQGKHHDPLAERNKLGSDGGSGHQFGSHVDVGFELTRRLSARLQQRLSDTCSVSTHAFGRHDLDVNDEQRSMAQSRLHCPPKDGPRSPRAVDGYADCAVTTSQDGFIGSRR